MSYQFTPGYNVADLTTTLTLDVWNDKLVREDRARREWHKRWGPAFGLSSRPDTPEPELRRVHPSQERPPSSGLAQTVPLEAATLKCNAAIAQTHMIPGRPPSVASVRSLNDRASQRCSVRSGASGASIPGVGAFSVTSSSKVERARVSRSCQKAPKAGRFDFPSSL
uniref:Uncharacterized protein n=1 Tax=Chrysotila carterae TaxID=13221 RepID=A0A7S4FDF3_CHRCT